MGTFIDQCRASSENNPNIPLPDPVKEISPDPLILTPFTHQTPSPQSSPPPGPHFRSRRTPGKERTLQNLESVECTWEKIQKLRFLYLLPGVEDHDIIGGEIILGQLPRNLLDLEGRELGGLEEGFEAFRKRRVYILETMRLIFNVIRLSYRWGKQCDFYEISARICQIKPKDLRWSFQSCWSRRRAWADGRPSCLWAWRKYGTLSSRRERSRTPLWGHISKQR